MKPTISNLFKRLPEKSGDAFDKMVADSDNFSDALKKVCRKELYLLIPFRMPSITSEIKMTGMSQEERKAAGYTSEMVEQIENWMRDQKRLRFHG